MIERPYAVSPVWNQWIPTASDCCRLEAQHGFEREALVAKLAVNHRHYPVSRKQLVPATRTALLDIDEEGVGVKHRRPISNGRVNHRGRF